MPAICFEMCPDEGVGTEGSDMWTGGGSTKQGVKCQQWNLGCRHVGFTVKCFVCCSYFVVVAVLFFFFNFHWNEFRKVWWEDGLEIKLGLREGEEQAEPQSHLPRWG